MPRISAEVDPQSLSTSLPSRILYSYVIQSDGCRSGCVTSSVVNSGQFQPLCNHFLVSEMGIITIN